MLSIWHLHLAQWTIDCGRCLGHSWLESEPHEKVGQGAICHGQRPHADLHQRRDQGLSDGGASTCMPCVELAQRCTLARCWPSASSLACIPLIALRGLIRLTRFATN